MHIQLKTKLLKLLKLIQARVPLSKNFENLELLHR